MRYSAIHLVTVIGLLAGSCLIATAQDVFLAGEVRDSATFAPLPYANIQYNRGKIIASTNAMGYFSVSVQEGDTLVVTRLGYAPFLLVAKENNWDVLVHLAEVSKMLDNVTVYDKFEIHGQDQIQKSIREGSITDSKSFQNPTQKAGNEYTVQTFGPGYTFKGAFSRLSKEEVEKRRMREIYLRQQRTAAYREVVQSEQAKQYFTKLFSISEATYMSYLESFAIQYPEAENLRTRKEVIDMLVAFFSTQSK